MSLNSPGAIFQIKKHNFLTCSLFSHNQSAVVTFGVPLSIANIHKETERQRESIHTYL